ncbi:hypothetical protein LIA77_01716 [Sarocladium implicatum]|nr:hypothetical protein LIA77_01716 [Sarocladium implicatum]
MGDTACACSVSLKKREERGKVRQRSSELRTRGRADGLGRGPGARASEWRGTGGIGGSGGIAGVAVATKPRSDQLMQSKKTPAGACGCLGQMRGGRGITGQSSE